MTRRAMATAKLDHVAEMLRNAMYHKQLSCYAVLMDSWYATKALMLLIESMQRSTTVR